MSKSRLATALAVMLSSTVAAAAPVVTGDEIRAGCRSGTSLGWLVAAAIVIFALRPRRRR